MSLSQGLRWSGKGISNGRQRLIGPRRSLRHFSLHTQRTQYRPAASRLPSNLRVHQQHRSLSLFGWGSAKPPSDEFASSHTSPQASPPTQVVGQTAETTSPVIETVRSVKASHATSDAPDPSILQAQPLNQIEPPALRAIEESIASPHGSTAADVLEETDLASIPEGIGYLKGVCGLDYGWGPTAFLEWSLEHIHIYSGLSWSASIVALALISRLAVLKFSFQASDQTVKMREVKPILDPLRQEYKEALAANDKARAMAIGGEIKAVSNESGISMLTMLLPLITQIPLTFGGFRLLRGACTLPVPAFEHEAWLWHTDLTMADPYILPLAISALTYVTMKGNLKSGTSTVSPQVMSLMLNGLPLVSLVFIHFQPGAVQIFFLANSVMSLLQSVLIRNARVRGLFGLAPLAPPTPVNSTPDMGPAPGGLNVRSSNTTSPALQEEFPTSSNRSLIDKAVDGFKSKRDETTSSVKNVWKSVSGQQADKIAKRKKDSLNAQMDRYERSRRQDLEVMRESKNQSAAAAAAAERERKGGEVAGMRTSRSIARRQKQGK